MFQSLFSPFHVLFVYARNRKSSCCCCPMRGYLRRFVERVCREGGSWVCG